MMAFEAAWELLNKNRREFDAAWVCVTIHDPCRGEPVGESGDQVPLQKGTGHFAALSLVDDTRPWRQMDDNLVPLFFGRVALPAHVQRPLINQAVFVLGVRSRLCDSSSSLSLLEDSHTHLHPHTNCLCAQTLEPVTSAS